MTKAIGKPRKRVTRPDEGGDVAQGLQYRLRGSSRIN